MFVLFIVKCYKKYIKTFVLIPSKPLRQEVSEGVKRLDILQAIAKSWVGIVRVDAYAVEVCVMLL